MPTRATLEFLEENGIPETTTKPPTTANAAEQDRKEQKQTANNELITIVMHSFGNLNIKAFQKSFLKYI